MDWILTLSLLAGVFAQRAAKLAPRSHAVALSLIPGAGFAWFVAKLPTIDTAPVVTASVGWQTAFTGEFFLKLDGLGVLMCALICFNGFFNVHYARAYAGSAAKSGPLLQRLFLLMAGMLCFVMADHLLLMFVAWEWMALVTWSLVAHKRESSANRRAANQVLAVNALSGALLLVSVITLAEAAGTCRISEMLDRTAVIAAHPLYPVMIGGVIGAALIRSAQVPFHYWLPLTIVAPTPASVAFSMVKAGVLLLARFHPVLGGTEAWGFTLMSAGIVTLLWGAVAGLTKTDLKEILAYTTLTALGLVTAFFGLGTPLAVKSALLFLFGQVLYKTTLFMVAGVAEERFEHRDARRMGGLLHLMPATAFAAMLAALSKAGFPPLFGAAKKTAILSTATEEFLPLFLLIPAMFANLSMLAMIFYVGVHPFWFRRKEPPTGMARGEPALGMTVGIVVTGISALVLGLFVESLARPLLMPAVGAVYGEPVMYSISPWWSLTYHKALGVVTIALGLLVYASRWEFWPKHGLESSPTLPERLLEALTPRMEAVGRGWTFLLTRALLSFAAIVAFAVLIGFFLIVAVLQ